MNLIEEVKKKKELSGLSDEFVKKILDKKLQGKKLLSSKEEKLIVKEVRNELRKYVGRFSSIKERKSLLEENDIPGLLMTHQSTKERINDYPILKKKIYDLRPTSILDVGCGLNPIALAKKSVPYYGLDVHEGDLEVVTSFFSKNKIQGGVELADMITIKRLPQTDLCLFLKVLDLVDKRGHSRAEELIKIANANKYVISFSTKTLSGRPMNHPQRGWIEQLLTRLGFTYVTWVTKNEIYYFATRI